MSARRKARKRALDVLFEADMRRRDPVEILAELSGRVQHPLNPYSEEIVSGVCRNLERIDDLLATYSVGWTLDRMPVVDRNVLRMGVWELLWGEVPSEVALAEATAVASALSTEESGPFVNGLLARIAEVRPYLVLND